jgi:hypothetical protein
MRSLGGERFSMSEHETTPSATTAADGSGWATDSRAGRAPGPSGGRVDLVPVLEEARAAERAPGPRGEAPPRGAHSPRRPAPGRQQFNRRP